VDPGKLGALQRPLAPLCPRSGLVQGAPVSGPAPPALPPAESRTGDLAEDILDAIPHSRINNVCYFDAGETSYPVGFNPATRIAPGRRALAAAGIVAAFKHLWSDNWGPRLEHLLYPRRFRLDLAPARDTDRRASTPTTAFASA